MNRQLCSSADLRDAVLGEIFAGCYENELDIQFFVHDLDAFAEGRAFKKVHYKTFLFYIDENFEKVKAILRESKGYLEKAQELDPNCEKCNWVYPLWQVYYALGDTAKADEMERRLNNK